MKLSLKGFVISQRIDNIKDLMKIIILKGIGPNSVSHFKVLRSYNKKEYIKA